MAFAARFCLVAFLLLAASPLLALSPVPDCYQVRSPNGQYLLQLSRCATTQSVLRIGESGLLWSFEATLAAQEYFLSDDGTTVIEIQRGYTRVSETQPSVVRLLRKGKLIEYPLSRLSSATPWLHRCWQEKNSVFVHALDGKLSRFDLGDFTLVEQRHETVAHPEKCRGGDYQRPPRKSELLIDAGLCAGLFVVLAIGLAYDVGRRKRAG